MDDHIYIYIYILHALDSSQDLSRSIRLLASAMFQRGAGPTEYEGCDPEVALQDEVDDMFAENIFSGSRASILLGKAQRCGLKLTGKFIKKLPGKSKQWKKNAARDMRRRIRKNDHWPDPYWLDCRVWNRVKQKEEVKKICILLPSEEFWRLSGNMV